MQSRLQPQVHVRADGTVKNDQPESADKQQASEQRPIEVEFPHDTCNVGQRSGVAFEQASRVTEAH
jgi:hypothetical protein